MTCHQTSRRSRDSCSFFCDILLLSYIVLLLRSSVTLNNKPRFFQLPFPTSTPLQRFGSLCGLFHKDGLEKERTTSGLIGILLVDGPPLGDRHDVQSIRNLDKYPLKTAAKKLEHVVKDVTAYWGRGKGRRYEVTWSDDSVTWEPRKNLVALQDGEEVILEPLLRFWERNPQLKRTL